MRLIIADDESLAREKLRFMLACEPGVQVVAECQDGAETVRALATYKPDILLMDIRMPDMDGFEVLSRVPVQDMPMVIFTTAYDSHAVRAFEAHALDYLLKPFDQERLHQAVNRARSELLKANDREVTERILHLLSESAGIQPSVTRRLIVKAGGRVLFLSFDEIDWVEAAANYIRIYAGKETYVLRKGIGEIAERLDPLQFIRIHRSTIVNVHKIKALQPVNSGEYIVILKDGKELSCSRGYRSGLQELVDKNL
ncbi:MAG: response regulator transcription factor [Acidobacteria bacterium]|nr:response regulator transcription factor [Acidobacteriota bacterium]MBV9625015.1 response regulator transcription factor [Acidobacteriota bacterium]